MDKSVGTVRSTSGDDTGNLCWHILGLFSNMVQRWLVVPHCNKQKAAFFGLIMQ